MQPATRAVSAPTLPASRLGSYPPARRTFSRRRFGRCAAFSLASLLALSLSGCDVRLETPPPLEPVPDAIEQVRRTAADDAEQIAQLSAVAALAEVPDAVREELMRINSDARAHLASVGGIYVSGLPSPVGLSDYASEEIDSLPQHATVPEVIEALNQAAARNLASAVNDSNGEKARLFASLALSQGLAAERLAALVEVENPDPISIWYGVASDVDFGSPDGDEATGITVSDFQAIVKSEDAARYAFEVTAARSEGDMRAAFRQRARVHGARAQAWAELGQIAETDQDPRLVAYQIPFELSPAELVLFVEKELSLRWAALIAAAAPGAREPFIEALLASQLSMIQWGGAVSTFPGMPELEGSFGSIPTAPDVPRIPYEWAAQLPEEPHDGPTD
jgi:hypothetical protein